MKRGFQVVLLIGAAVLILQGAQSLRVPATFDGVLACEGCPASRVTLTIAKEGIYTLRRTILESDRDPESHYEIGRWEFNNDRLLLRGAASSEFALTGTSLRNSNGELRRRSQLALLDGTLQLRGLYRNGKFEECTTGKSFVLDAETERAIASLASGARQGLLTLLGHLEGASLVVDKPLKLSPGDTCASPSQQGASPSSVLEGTWVLTKVSGKPLPATVTRPPYLTFANGKASGFAGCNRFGGGFQATPASLKFDNLISTQMACAGAAMQIEDEFLQALQSTTTSRRSGDILELLSGGRLLATLRKR